MFYGRLFDEGVKSVKRNISYCSSALFMSYISK